jgi:hypothetical protein
MQLSKRAVSPRQKTDLVSSLRTLKVKTAKSREFNRKQKPKKRALAYGRLVALAQTDLLVPLCGS